MAGSRRFRSQLISSAILILVLGACSVEGTTPIPSCANGDSAWIVAQSVPTAELLPCFEPLPAGWEVDGVSVDQEGTVIRFDSDRAGDEAASLRFEENCIVEEDAVPQTSARQAVDRFDRIDHFAPGFRLDRFYRFSGGCLIWSFDFEGDSSSSLAFELEKSLVLIERQVFNEIVAEEFIDEEL